ncbi:MAG: hypothetical protein A3K31_08735 [Ignavibacteria bacterium RIFOXYA12_FULL_35_25]|nr:MAG: hypothetical protein A2254_04580 [Ignavibacteria bacterium RIFOXYA2_FULL_35_9]OGU84502.1 MAG: hypothetical protein A3K31_08735 [Ignavibacteria bacterium RIFOXYA12_FULL_35_25]OGU92028.1 MAG: hypothetical protein A2492_01195 [Ignavibacteria bacterium RIFOXYC12_FULL_35_11]OGV32993.1 MAG: hypothetical protein A2523_01815 [Ignavibacteria bacterium RIFOXYD12_FULL_36_8]HAB51812.1 hypothetical protein [Ignavibacteriales bacterium]
MRVKVSTILVIIILGGFAQKVFSYPPAVGILGNAKSCMSCHVNNGPWSDENKTIIDILDKETMKSLRRSNGTFLIEVKRGEQKTVLTVIGRTKDDNLPAPFRNAWTYVDSSMIGTNSISKFVPGWAVNLQMACRLVGDKLMGFEDAEITALPMTVQPLYDANDGELTLQVMITKGESVKGNAKIGMLGNYFERKVILKVIE